MSTDVAHRDHEVRSSYTRTFENFVSRLQCGLQDASRQRALQLAVTLIGGVAIARAFDDEELAKELFAACRTAGRALVEDSRQEPN
jgi:TetR/AcrR family transcriptional repressor of nem operon